MKLSIYLLLFLIISHVGVGQENVTLSGYIRDANNGEGMIGLSIYVKELKTGTQTNAYGFYSLTIPRAVCVLAGGKFQNVNGESIFNVEAQAGSKNFGILQSPFMIEKAKTKKFRMELSIKKNELKYREVMFLQIYGKDFEHIDESTHHRVTYDLD